MKMEGIQGEYKLLECENIQIAVLCEQELEHNEPMTTETYYPSTFLTYTELGVLDVFYENKVYSFEKGSFCLIRKYSHVIFSKKRTKKDPQIRFFTFIMPDVFLRKIIADFKFKKNLEPIGERILELPPTEKLNAVIQSIKYAVDNEISLNMKELEANIEEVLKAIVHADPKLAMLFKEFSLAKRADLNLFMNTNYMLKVPLQQLAQMSGRSLSTFTREFKIIFGISPHKWILKKRLHIAHALLIEGKNNISHVCLESGFEDLGHFSRSFKKEFGVNPSDLTKCTSLP